MSERIATQRLTKLMDRRPWVRYLAAAVLVGIIAARDGFVLAQYPPATSMTWVIFAIGAAVAIALVALLVWRAPTTGEELRDHPWWIVRAVAALILILFGLIAGLGWALGGSINIAGENSDIRSFALGAALGGVALFGIGSYRGGRTARQRRQSQWDM